MWWRTVTAQFGGGLVYAPKAPQPAAPAPQAAPTTQTAPTEDLKSEAPQASSAKAEAPSVNGPHDESATSKGNNDPYAVGTTRAQQEMDDLNQDPNHPAWYNTPLGTQIERLHMNQSVHPESPMEMGDTDPQTIRNFQEYNTGKGEQAFKDNPATLHTI